MREAGGGEAGSGRLTGRRRMFLKVSERLQLKVVDLTASDNV